MQLAGDLHTHTIASPGAFSTVAEVAQAAAERGLSVVAITDHGPDMNPGGAHILHFRTLDMVPPQIHGVRILRGIEANIMDGSGRLDIPLDYLDNLDFIITGFHEFAWAGGTLKENTEAVIAAIENPLVHMISHIGNPAYPVELEACIECASCNNTMIELNNSSLKGTRPNSGPNCRKVARLCREYGVLVSINSDAHIHTSVGVVDQALELARQAGISADMIVNSTKERILNYLNIDL